MADTVRADAAAAMRDAVPFLVITVIWLVVMVVIYGLFLATKPSGVDYGASIHASVFVPGLVGLLGQTVYEIRTA